MCIKIILICVLIFLLVCKTFTEQNTYVSHSREPRRGEFIKNSNPKCLHYESEGPVLKIDELPNGMGKAVTYLVKNNGPNFIAGDVLTKTLDQLSPK